MLNIHHTEVMLRRFMMIAELIVVTIIDSKHMDNETLCPRWACWHSKICRRLIMGMTIIQSLWILCHRSIKQRASLRKYSWNRKSFEGKSATHERWNILSYTQKYLSTLTCQRWAILAHKLCWNIFRDKPFPYMQCNNQSVHGVSYGSKL